MPTQEGAGTAPNADALLQLVARGDEAAFARLYDILIGPVFGLVRRVLRDDTQCEEVVGEIMVALWQTAARYSPERGSAMTWALTLAHRRAVDRVRSAQSAVDREDRVVRGELSRRFDEVTEQVGMRREHDQVRRGLGALTDVQREAVMLAYYDGRTYREVGELLGTPPGTTKTGLRDGLIRLRDCWGATR
ncbi:MAG TPA: ECF RNA polymerase sigma factor SigK [Actinophytocola sp.]|uniref:ECF RNA polymerase sigma factor SigK n=1 Tax=Actinophytocola sp. TaxID=1872138 RepID=UPI002DB75BDA|nr:ECF RNA polymerase sigma factor SigK [Actinophytocola sp.]HEU5469268.1 ECF RNA polymerase sigma factor SigK [Actinophytocola sp.]